MPSAKIFNGPVTLIFAGSIHRWIRKYKNKVITFSQKGSGITLTDDRNFNMAGTIPS
jgi:hypothetical protein